MPVSMRKDNKHANAVALDSFWKLAFQSWWVVGNTKNLKQLFQKRQISLHQVLLKPNLGISVCSKRVYHFQLSWYIYIVCH